jgi:hypothetical protein
LLFTVPVGLLLGAALLAGPDYLTGFKFTTLDRFEGTAPVGSLVWDVAQWIGVPFLIAAVGAVAYAIGRSPSRASSWRRAAAAYGSRCWAG